MLNCLSTRVVLCPLRVRELLPRALCTSKGILNFNVYQATSSKLGAPGRELLAQSLRQAQGILHLSPGPMSDVRHVKTTAQP